MKQVTIAATDGYRLSAHTFGDAATARAGVLIVPAMGVEQTYYAPFAHWLADRGYFVVTFDYRGMGHSRHGPLSELQADVLTWVNRDCAALVASCVALRLPRSVWKESATSASSAVSSAKCSGRRPGTGSTHTCARE